MNRTLIIAAGIVLLIVAAVIGVGQLGGTGGGAGDGDDRDPARKNRSSKGGSAPRVPATPVDAAKYLRSLINAGNEGGVAFRELERLAEKLRENDLEELIDLVEMEDASGVKGWVRCALFAEWARRDPEAAMKYMEEYPIADGPDYAIEQAWFSLFRGWAEDSPMQAYEALTTMGNTSERPGGLAYQHATAAIIRELARDDVEATWKMVRESEGGFTNEDALAGFFAGLRDSEDAQKYLAEWNAAQWDTDEARAAHALYDRQRNRGGSAIVQVPSEEGIVVSIAGAWAQQDLDAALAWLMENGPGNRHHRAWRASQVARDWARNQPAAALRKLADKTYADQHIFFGHGAIAGNPSLATEVMQELDGYTARTATMMTILSAGDDNDHAAYFPAPGSSSRLHDAEEHYRNLLDGINAGNFPERKEREFFERLHFQFRDLVPEAREALEAIRSR